MTLRLYSKKTRLNPLDQRHTCSIHLERKYVFFEKKRAEPEKNGFLKKGTTPQPSPLPKLNRNIPSIQGAPLPLHPCLQDYSLTGLKK